MAAAILYQYPLAFNPQKALFAIHEKGLANKVEMRYINLFNGQSLRPWYMKINPNSTAPAMVLTGDKPRTLVQTINILHWVDEQGPGPLGGTEVDRPLVNELVDALQGWDGNLFAFANMPASAAGILGPLGAFRREVAKAEMAKAEAAGDHALAAAYKAKLAAMAKSTERDEAAIASNKKELGDLLDRAEKLLDKSKYLAGPVFSMADVVMAAILFRLGTVQQTKMWLEPRPKLSAYFTQLKARPAYKKTFGPVSSTWGQASNIIPAVVKAKLCMAFRWYA